MSVEVFYDPDKIHPQDINGIVVIEERYFGIVNNLPNRRIDVPQYVLDIFRGNNRTIRAFMRDPNGDVINTTGSVGIFTAKATKDSATTSIQLRTDVSGEGQIGAGDDGELIFYFVPTTTDSLDIRQYVFDITLEISGSTYTTTEGRMNLKQTVA
jgi:hypothetical protein